MRSTSWGTEHGSGLPQVTIGLDAPVYSGINATNIVGRPDYRGLEVVVIFDSEAGARIAMPTILQQLKDANAIHGHLHDSYTGASVY